MTGLELQAARERLGVTHRELAEYADVTPNDVLRWEQCKEVPTEFERELKVALWALALDAALAGSGLPECAFVRLRDPMPDTSEIEILREHLRTCPTCRAHQQFVQQRLGEPPFEASARLGGRVRRFLNTLHHWHRSRAIGVVQAAFLGRPPT